MLRRVVGIGLAGLCVWAAGGRGEERAAVAAGAAAGEARVDGKPLLLAHAYLFHAPDNWNEQEINAVALLTPEPADEAALRAAATLAEALQVAPRRVVVEVRRGGERADLSICHPGLGDGMCYSTGILVPEWTAAQAAPGHLAGSVRTFTGKEEEIFQGKFKLFYQFRFDAAPVRDFEKRR